jgi:hypothetical protein
MMAHREREREGERECDYDHKQKETSNTMTTCPELLLETTVSSLDVADISIQA